MGSLATAAVGFVITAGAGIAGLALGRRLPGHHLNADSRDAVRLVSGFVAALTALVLGLLIASAKSNFDEHNGQLHRIAADVVALDRTLAHYGDGARDARIVLRAAFAEEYDRLSAGDRLRGTGFDQLVQDPKVTGFYDLIQALAPQDEGQRTARDRALQLTESIAATRVLMTQNLGGSIPAPFLLVLGSWVAAMFASFGLFARANSIVVASLLAGAASVSGAVFLILELDRPLVGVMRLSTEPLRHALSVLAAVGP